MESSTGHLALCNHINLSGCGWLKLDQASSSQFDVVYVYMVKKGITWPSMHFCFGLQQGRLCNSDLSRLKLSVKVTNLCSKLLRTEVIQCDICM